MIAKLAGVVEQIEPDAAVIDVNGVGYLTFCSTRTIGRLPPPGSSARLLIETHVREDHIHLYGFIDAVERDWFRLLTTVQGVGARFQSQFDRPWRADEPRQGRLVVIGEKGLDAAAIRRMILD